MPGKKSMKKKSMKKSHKKMGPKKMAPKKMVQKKKVSKKKSSKSKVLSKAKGKSIEGLHGYCVRKPCKTKRLMMHAVVKRQNPNGSYLVVGACEKCNQDINTFVGKDRI